MIKVDGEILKSSAFSISSPIQARQRIESRHNLSRPVSHLFNRWRPVHTSSANNYTEIVSGGSVPVLVTVRAWLLVFGGGVGLTCVSLGLLFVSLGFTFELGGGGRRATLLMLLTVLALKLGTGI